MNDLSVAAVVMRSEFGKVETNLHRMKYFTERAADQGVDIVCFPEMGITGYALKEEMRSLAEPVPGPSTEKVQQIAAANNLFVIAGLAERTDDGGIAITQIAVSPRGEVGKYRKIHLSAGEQTLFQAGNEIPVFKTERTIIGMQLCYDAHFPELSTMLALKGAEVLFMPHASPARESAYEKRDRWLRYLSARAYDNSVFLVACNQVGDGGAGIHFPGVALVLDPRGELIAETSGNEEAMIVSELKAEALRKTRNTRMGFFLSHRRPELYEGLTEPMDRKIFRQSSGKEAACEEEPPECRQKARVVSDS